MSLLCHHQGYFHGIVRSVHRYVQWLRSEVYISIMSADMVQTKRPVWSGGLHERTSADTINCLYCLTCWGKLHKSTHDSTSNVSSYNGVAWKWKWKCAQWSIHADCWGQERGADVCYSEFVPCLLILSHPCPSCSLCESIFVLVPSPKIHTTVSFPKKHNSLKFVISIASSLFNIIV